MGDGGVLALSESCPLVEWKTRLAGHQPQFKGKDDASTTWLPLVDDYCEFIRDRWVYVLLRLKSLDKSMVAFEIYVDEDGNTFYAHRTSDITPRSPIPQRTPPINMPGASGPTVSLPLVDEFGQALEVRLLYSRFRLPSATVRSLTGKWNLKAIHNSIPPLWEWRYGYEDRTPLYSKDGFSLVETPLWMGPKGDQMRVWAGTDPFSLVENNSNEYVRLCNRYINNFQPSQEPRKQEVLRLALGRAITSSILENSGGHKRYAGSVDISELNLRLGEDDALKTKLIRRREQRSALLCKVLDSRLFKIAQKASFDQEGIEPEEMSERLVEHIRVLSIGTRLLGESKSGRALLASWAEDAEGNPDHFLNRAAYPQVDPPISHFKAYRWSSKAIAGIISESIAYRIRVRRAPIGEKLAGEIQTFLRLGIGEAFDPRTGITDFSLADDLVTHGTLELKKFRVAAPGNIPFSDRSIKFAAVDPTMDALFEEWMDAGQLSETGRNKEFLDSKFFGGTLLDLINLTLAMAAIEEAEGGDEAMRSMFGAGVAGLSLLINTGEQALKWGLDKHLNAKRAVRLFVGLKVIVGAYYAVSNLVDAQNAFRQGDSDRGFALDLAAGAELTAAVGQLWALALPGSVVAPWVVPIAGAVAAAAYIAAMHLEDDPMQQFLENCAWGSAPYSESKEHWAWSEKSVAEWEKDYVTQADTLLRLLVRLRGWWSLDSWPAVTVGWELSQPTTTLKAEYIVTFKNKTEFIAEVFEFQGPSIPKKGPYRVTLKPKRNYNASAIDTVIVRLTLVVDPGTKPEILDCLLKENGVGDDSGKASRVPTS